MTEHLMTRSRTTIVLVAGAVSAWAITVDRMRGMDTGPGTDLGGLGWYLGIWVTMTAAMMLPSAAPAAQHVARLACRVPTLLFTAGYLAVWTGYGLLAYGVFRVLTSFDIGWLAWDRGGPYAAGAAITAAGLYELTLLKRVSLRRCRSTPHGGNAFRSGLAHGLDCVGCSGALMAVLFVLGERSHPAYYRRMAERLATSFPDFRLEVFDRRHHFDPPHRAEPERYARLLEDHWRRAEDRSP